MNKFFKLSKKIFLGLIVIAVCLFTFIASPTDTLKNNTNKVTLNADTLSSQISLPYFLMQFTAIIATNLDTPIP